MTDTAVLLLNLGGPLRQGDVEPFMYKLFADAEIVRFPGPRFLQPLPGHCQQLKKRRRRNEEQ